ATAPAVTTFVVRFRGHVVVLAFRFFWMPQRCARAIERLRLAQRNIDKRIDKLEELAIRRFLIKIVSLVTDSVTLAALHSMVVVVEYFLERAAINYGLVPLETFALLSFERLDGNGTKLDPLHCAPRLRVPFQNLNSVKSGAFKR